MGKTFASMFASMTLEAKYPPFDHPQMTTRFSSTYSFFCREDLVLRFEFPQLPGDWRAECTAFVAIFAVINDENNAFQFWSESIYVSPSTVRNCFPVSCEGCGNVKEDEVFLLGVEVCREMF